MVSSAASCFSGVTPAQHEVSTKMPAKNRILLSPAVTFLQPKPISSLSHHLSHSASFFRSSSGTSELPVAQTRCTALSIRYGFSRNADILYTDGVMQAGCHSQQHAWCLHGFRKDAVDRTEKNEPQRSSR